MCIENNQDVGLEHFISITILGRNFIADLSIRDYKGLIICNKFLTPSNIILTINMLIVSCKFVCPELKVMIVTVPAFMVHALLTCLHV